MSVIASMDGDNYFAKSDFFAESIYYAHYQLQPGNKSIYPGGDLARNIEMPVSPLDRDYIQTATYWLRHAEARKYAQWYLKNIMPSYINPDTNCPFLFNKDLIFTLSLSAKSQKRLPLSYRASGTEWVNFRSGWVTDDTCVTLSGSPIIDQDHPHWDVGSFTIWKHGWLALDTHTLIPNVNDDRWEPRAHNMLHVEGSERRYVLSVPGLRRCVYVDDSQNPELSYAYVQVDGTNLYRKKSWPEDNLLLNEWTREFVYLKPDTVVVYDRVEPKEGIRYHLRFHFPGKVTYEGGFYQASNEGGGISLLPLLSGDITAISDTGFWGVQEDPLNPSTGRFLNILQVASGDPPTLEAGRLTTMDYSMEGVLWENNVVLFSTKPRGESPDFPFSYTVPVTATLTHMLLNMPEGSYDIVATPSEEQTIFQVASGNTYTTDSQGVLRFMI